MQNVHRKLLIVLSCLLVAVVIEATLPARSGKPAASAAQLLTFLPYHFGPYTGRDVHTADVEGYPGEIHRVYRQAQGGPLELLAFPTPINHAPENCLPYLGWSVIDHQHRKLQANPGVEIQTIVAVPDSASEHPLVCGFYQRRNNAAKANIFSDWLQDRRSTIMQSLEAVEIVSICTNVDDSRQAGPAMGEVYDFASAIEPYFYRDSTPATQSASNTARRRARRRKLS